MSNPWTHTQGKTGLTVSGTTLVITPNTQPSPGDTIFVGIRVPDNTFSISSVVDDAGPSHTYYQIGNTGTNPRIGLFVTAVARSMTAITITVSATTQIEAEVEIFNAGSISIGFSQQVTATGTTETSLAVASYTPKAGDILVSFLGTSGVVTTWTPGSGWTLGAQGGLSVFQYILNASGGAETSPMTISPGGTGWSEKATAWRIIEPANRLQVRQAVKRAAYW